MLQMLGVLGVWKYCSVKTLEVSGLIYALSVDTGVFGSARQGFIASAAHTIVVGGEKARDLVRQSSKAAKHPRRTENRATLWHTSRALVKVTDRKADVIMAAWNAAEAPLQGAFGGKSVWSVAKPSHWVFLLQVDRYNCRENWSPFLIIPMNQPQCMIRAVKSFAFVHTARLKSEIHPS